MKKEKINIAELLKNCPKGMELDCTIYDGLVFVSVNLEVKDYPIKTQLEDGTFKWFTFDGKYELYSNAKCVISPKGKTTWEGFVPPCEFKDGDIVYVKDKYEQAWCSIIKNCKDGKLYTYVDICIDSNSIYSDKLNILCYCKDMIEYRLATEKEKEKLFDAIKVSGYRWNAETKTLEKLLKSYEEETMNKAVFDGNAQCCDIMNGLIKEKVSSKFGINSLKPYDKVLVRDSNTQKWIISFFSHYDNNQGKYKYFCINNTMFAQCIPYENNEHLLNKRDACTEYYKTW